MTALASLLNRVGRPADRELPILAGGAGLAGAFAAFAFRHLRLHQLELGELARAMDSAAIAMTRPDGTITHWSRGCQQLYGWTAEQALGAKKYELLQSRCEQPGWSTDHCLEGPAELELIEVCRYGTAITVQQNTQVVDRPRREGRRIFKMVDISDRRASERRLRELDGELALMSRQSAMGALAADLAHEINQPLSATANYLATARLLIERGATIGQVSEAIAQSEQQVLRAGDIIRRLRDFLSRHEVDKRVESLDQTVRESIDLVLFGPARLDIDLVLRLDAGCDSLFIDRIQVQQVLVNLLRNAAEVLRDCPAGKRQIVIASRRLDARLVEVSVSDSGPGLPDKLDNLFNPRFTSAKGPGSMGLGLSISKRIIEAHGGTLGAENGQEGGAVFRFSLPSQEGMA